MSATDLVPTGNMAALDTLDTEAREVAITGMLDQARSWLAHAVESTAPAQDINQFRQFIATAAETAKRLKVSKEIQQDAEVMVRRSERALGQAIRAGQERGEIARRGQGVSARPPGAGRDRVDSGMSLPTHLAPSHELSGNGAGIYHLTDGVTDDEFEEAITRAEQERNVSRANVVRKVREVKTGAERQAEKWERIASLAAEGYTRRQIAEITGMSHEGLSAGAKREGITFPADRVVGKTRTIDTNRVISQSVAQLEGLAMALDLINPDDIDPERAQEWSDSLTQSIRALRKAHNQIKESLS